MNKRTYIAPAIEVAAIDGEALLAYSEDTNLGKSLNDCTAGAKQRYSDEEEGEAEENYGFDYDW